MSDRILRGGHAEMFALVASLPDQLAASADLVGLAEVAGQSGRFDRILLCGMGGSAIAGDLVQPLLQGQSRPLVVWRDYGLPHWVGPRDLVIAASYSGNTEETLAAVAAAREKACPILAITSGGALAEQAAEWPHAGGCSVVELPPGLPPRAALGYSLGALVRVLGILGLVTDAESELAGAIGALESLNAGRMAPYAAGGIPGGAQETTPGDEGQNPPVADLADRLQGRIPVIYSTGAETHAAALRLKAQLNENSKMPACLGAFPELNHNDLVGWCLAPEMRGRFVLLILRGLGENERDECRVSVTRRLLAEDIPAAVEITTTASGTLARILSLVQYGDFLSCHLAQLSGVDPMPVERIQRLKEALAELD